MLPPKNGVAAGGDGEDESMRLVKKKREKAEGKEARPAKGGAQCESVDKPGSVVDDHSSATSVTAACSNLPESAGDHG